MAKQRGTPRATTTAAALTALERTAREYGDGVEATKLGLLRQVDRAALTSAAQVLRFHEVLCFLRAYPDSRALELEVERMLAGFAKRPDLIRFRAALGDSGIAGTAIHYRFFNAMAEWLADRWPKRLSLDWKEFENRDRLETFLPLFAHFGESPGLDEYDLGLEGWVKAMKGDHESDAAFLVRRFRALAAADTVREKLYDELDPPMTLAPGPEDDPPTPSRTLALHANAPHAQQRRPLARSRPDLRVSLAETPRRVRAVGGGEARALVDLARAAMVTRSRDLDAFSYGDPHDVRLFDWGEGLGFACIGVQPERRLMLESVYAFLTLRNGVPIGYVLNSALYGSAEIAYNVFDTYRGAEAASVYAKVLAMVRHVFGADAFTIFPYQLGDGNDEAIESGAWWFYRKFGFAPRHAATVRLMHAEEARMAKKPGHRSSAATLRTLARENLYFHLGAERDDVIGELPIPSVGLAVTRYLAANWGSDRERAELECSREAGAMLGVPCEPTRESVSPAPLRWNAIERLWWRRWSPLVCILPGVSQWNAGERAALAEVIRLKASKRESDFVRAFDAHPRLREAVHAIAVKTKT